ncbi:glycosyltransferase family 2 protein [Candidatus Latescibacterota bacterium]
MESEAINYSVVVPVYNSADTLGELHERLTRTMQSLGGTYEIIMVDDGSTDTSPHLIEQLASVDPCLRCIRLVSNVGQHRAVMRAFREVRGRYIITIDDDLQYLPEDIPNLLAAMAENPSPDIVIGVPRDKKQTSFRKLLSLLFHQANTFLLNQKPTIIITPFKVISRELTEKLLVTPPGRFATIGTALLLLKPTIVNVPITHSLRNRGSSGYGFLKMARIARDLVGFYFSVIFDRKKPRSQKKYD